MPSLAGGLRGSLSGRLAVVLVLAWACQFRLPAPAAAQGTGRAAPRQALPVPVSAAASPIEVDGVLDEPAWKTAALIALDYEWAPGDNATPPVATECLVTFSDSALYVAFRAADPRPSEIRAHLMDRDSIDTFVQDDHVGLMIDTFNDERRGYQFRINPLGVQADAVFSELDGIEDWSWDSIWKASGRITAEGYVVEVAIPFNQLRFPGGSGPGTWGFEAFRSYPRNVRHRISSRFTDRSKGCILCQENKVTGLSGMKPGRNVELDPTVTAHRTDTRPAFPSGPREAGPLTGDVGVTARWGMTPNLTLSAAANPDFSQVEADVAQLDVNTRFALYYPEKRPFFLEGVDYFATPIQAVFTRTVADPSGGLKLTGKSGANAVGVFVTRDRFNSFVLPSNQSSDFASTDDEVTGAVVRYRRDVASRSTVGFVYAGREAGAYHNRVAGPDFFVRFSTSDTLRVQVLRSDTAYPEGVARAYGQASGSLGANAVYADYEHISRDWAWFGSYQDLGRDFRADSGFLPRVDTREGFGSLSRRFWGRTGGWFTRAQIGVSASRTEDHGGQLTDQSLSVRGYYQGPLQSEAQGALSRNREFYQGTIYDLDRVNLALSSQPSGRLRVSLNVRAGDDIDVANARQATSLRVAPGLEWKPGRTVNLQLDHTFERLAVAGGWLYTARLTQARVVYHFGVRSFVRGILQYTDVSRDAARFVAPVASNSRRLFSQFLFSYKLNPQTVLLVGYSDNYSGLTGTSLTQANRTFFFKVGYAWVM